MLLYRRNKSVAHLKMQSTDGCYSMCGEEEFESPFDVIKSCMENPDILREKDGGTIELKQPLVNVKKPTRYTIYVISNIDIILQNTEEEDCIFVGIVKLLQIPFSHKNQCMECSKSFPYTNNIFAKPQKSRSSPQHFVIM